MEKKRGVKGRCEGKAGDSDRRDWGEVREGGERGFGWVEELMGREGGRREGGEGGGGRKAEGSMKRKERRKTT